MFRHCPSLSVWILLISGTYACSEPASSTSPTEATDCRNAGAACATGFDCRASANGTWSCTPATDADTADSEVDNPQDSTRPGSDAGPQNGAGEPCKADNECLSGSCGDAPGGFCIEACVRDSDCTDETACVLAPGGRMACLPRCSNDSDCRTDWICASQEQRSSVCRPHCDLEPCPRGFECQSSTGLCVDPGCVPEVEVCNGRDDDCDGENDESVTNACGTCGEPPAERCDGDDDDCDGTVDENVTNACGTCGAVPREACNQSDDDCDGRTDEGVVNACGGCGPVPIERCDAVDQNCDGQVDNGATCANGEVCRNGACRAQSTPAGPCSSDDDCSNGQCQAEFPGGFCEVSCATDEECGLGAACVNQGQAGRRMWPRRQGQANICLERCLDECRPGWTCYAQPAAEGVCFTTCVEDNDCADGYVCENTGRCEVAFARVQLLRAYISPGDRNGADWDGFGSVGDEIIRLAAEYAGAQIGVPGADQLLEGFAQFISGRWSPPDPIGSATLLQNGNPAQLQLRELQDTHAPDWGRSDIAWDGVQIGPDTMVQLQLSLEDADVDANDQVGTVTVDRARLYEAMLTGEPYAVPVVDQGTSILSVVLNVTKAVRPQACAPGCEAGWQGDGICDAACNNAGCNFDANDCVELPPEECAPGCEAGWPGDMVCDAACNNAQCNFDLGDCPELPPVECAPGCEAGWPGDGFCDQACDNAACGFDLNDCAQSGPAGPCADDSQCASGACDTSVPGGFCGVECLGGADCGADAICVALADVNLCLERCDGQCRPGWVCIGLNNGEGACFVE